MKKKLLAILGALILVISCSSAGFAAIPDDGGDIAVPYETDTVSFSISRTSDKTANVGIYVSFSQTVDQYSVVVYLQKLSNGSWVLDTSNPDYVLYNNGFNKRSFLFSKTYSGLQRGTTYRIKCVSKDYIDGTPHISTSYSKTF